MRIPVNRKNAGFTLVEMMASVGCGTIILAVILAAGVTLQKSYAATEAYATAESDQLRVLDYIAMDCRRATAASVSTVTVSGNSETALVLTLPAYYSTTGTTAVANAPTVNGTTLSYGAGSVTIKYYQSNNNFVREVIAGASDNTTPIARNVSTFTVNPLDLTSSVSCSIMFFPTFMHNAGNGTWRSGVTNPDTAPDNSIGSNGDWYVINNTAANVAIVGDVYLKAGGAYSKVQNVKATQVYCNTFLRNASARQ